MVILKKGKKKEAWGDVPELLAFKKYFKWD